MVGKGRSTAPIMAPRPAYRRGLGFRGRQVLDLIADYIAMTGGAPSYETIVDELGFCDKAAVCRCIAALERTGHVSRRGKIGRGKRRIVVL